jgi:hypothetical protein
MYKLQFGVDSHFLRLSGVLLVIGLAFSSVRIARAEFLFQDTPYPQPTSPPTLPATPYPAQPTTQPPAPTNTSPPGITPTITGSPGTPLPTTTLVPLPSFTLLFPAITPTASATAAPVIDPEQPAWTAPRTTGPGGLPPQVGLLGGLIFTVWMLLGGFLVVYLKKIGH